MSDTIHLQSVSAETYNGLFRTACGRWAPLGRVYGYLAVVNCRGCRRGG